MADDPTGAVFSALSDPTRRRVILALSERGSATATELATILPITRQAATKHLHALAAAGLATAERSGRERRFHLTPRPLEDAMGWMAEVGAAWDKRLGSLQAFLARRRPKP